MFSICEEKEKKGEIFYSIQQASEKTGIPPKIIGDALKTSRAIGRGRYFSEKDKKVFWIIDEDFDVKYIRIGNENFPNLDSVLFRFVLTRDDFIYQLCNEKGALFDYAGKEHEIRGKSSSLRILVDALQQAKMVEKLLVNLPPSEAHEKARSLIEEIEKLF